MPRGTVARSSMPGSRPIRSWPGLADALAVATTPQRILARAVMNGETTDPDAWRAMFPTLFGPDADPAERTHAETVLAASLDVADRGEQVRSQFRGAIVESLTSLLLARRAGPSDVRRERRILFDGVRAESTRTT